MTTPTSTCVALWSAIVLLIVPATIAGASGQTDMGNLTIQVTGLRVTKGYLVIMVSDSAATFFTRERSFAVVRVRPSGTSATVSLRGIPRGTYAVSAFLDENANNTLDRTVKGIPKERIGFSNNPRVKNPPPPFERCAFVLDAADMTLTVDLR